MLDREPWHREASEAELSRLLHIVETGEGLTDETFEEIARFVQRYDLKEIPDIPKKRGGKARVFLYLYPSFMDDLKQDLLSVVGRSFGGMVPYYAVADRLGTWGLDYIEVVAEVAQDWDEHRWVTLSKMRKLEEHRKGWEEILGQDVGEPIHPDTGMPFIQQRHLDVEGIDLPGWLAMYVPE